MKKSSDERFEKELLLALRGPMRAAERNAARTRVAQRLQSTLSHLEVGAAGALPLLLEAPAAAASQTAASVAASTKVAAGASSALGGTAAAAGTGAASAGAAVVAAHPLGVLLTAFALGAGAGGSALLALSAGHVFERGVASKAPAVALSAAPRPSSKLALPQTFESVSAASNPAPAVLADGNRGVESPAPARPRAPASSAGSQVVASSRAAAVDARSGAVPTSPSEPRPETLTAQQALLDRARAALAQGDGGRALAALSEHARIHPASELAEEREALTIKSLIAAGDRAGARARAAGFAARYPRSLFLPSIHSALPENP